VDAGIGRNNGGICKQLIAPAMVTVAVGINHILNR